MSEREQSGAIVDEARRAGGKVDYQAQHKAIDNIRGAMDTQNEYTFPRDVLERIDPHFVLDGDMKFLGKEIPFMDFVALYGSSTMDAQDTVRSSHRVEREHPEFGKGYARKRGEETLEAFLGKGKYKMTEDAVREVKDISSAPLVKDHKSLRALVDSKIQAVYEAVAVAYSSHVRVAVRVGKLGATEIPLDARTRDADRDHEQWLALDDRRLTEAVAELNSLVVAVKEGRVDEQILRAADRKWLDLSDSFKAQAAEIDEAVRSGQNSEEAAPGREERSHSFQAFQRAHAYEPEFRSRFAESLAAIRKLSESAILPAERPAAKA